MNYTEAAREIESGTIRPVYLLFGREDYLQEELVARLRQALVPPGTEEFNYHRLDGKSEGALTRALAMAETLPFMCDRRLVVVADVQGFGGDGGEIDTYLRYLERPAPSTCLVLIAGGEVDRRRRAVKMTEVAGAAVECTPPRGRDLTAWVGSRAARQGLRLTPEAIASLVESAGDSLRLLVGEVEKLALYAGPDRAVDAADVSTLVGRTAQENVFPLVDAVGERRIERALPLLKRILAQGEPPVRLLFMLARQFRLIAQVQDLFARGFTSGQVQTRLGLMSFQVQRYAAQARNFSPGELAAALARVLDADQEIKGGRLEAELALQLLLVDLCATPAARPGK